MKLEGGFILHIDGTCDGKSPILMSGLDSITEIVLGNIKMPSEKASEIIPFLEKINERFGMPIAVVSDMGRGIIKAVKTVFPNIPHFICHFHFLRDIGKDMFGSDYALIRNRLKSHGIRALLNRRLRALNLKLTSEAVDAIEAAIDAGNMPLPSSGSMTDASLYSLIQWTMTNRHKGYGFPFDCPHSDLALRLFHLFEKVSAIRAHTGGKKFFRLQEDLKPLINDTQLKSAMDAVKT